MLSSKEFEVYDGSDTVIASINVNVYNNELRLENFLGLSLKFKFLNTDKAEGDKDIQVKGEGTSAEILISNKIKNSLGSGSVDKLEIVREENRSLWFSIYASKVGQISDALNVTLTFYQREV